MLKIKKTDITIFTVFVLATSMLISCSSSDLLFLGFKLSNKTTRLMRQKEKDLLRKYNNTFLSVENFNLGLVWCYYKENNDSTTRILLYKISEGKIKNEYVIPYPKSFDWIYNYYNPCPEILKNYSPLDPNTFRLTTRENQKLQVRDIGVAPPMLSEFSDSIEVYLGNFYYFTGNQVMAQKYGDSDSTIYVPIGSFYSSLAQDLRDYILPTAFPYDYNSKNNESPDSTLNHDAP